MARIMITGSIDIDDIDETLVDLTDPTGLTPDGFETPGRDDVPAAARSS